MATFNPSQPYGLVAGDNSPAYYEQGGVYFDIAGNALAASPATDPLNDPFLAEHDRVHQKMGNVVTCKTDAITGVITGFVAAGWVYGATGIIPRTRDDDGIDAAVAYITSTGRPGVIQFEAADYTISRDHTLTPNISYIGVYPQMVMSGNVPDASFATIGGTRFICADGVTAFKFNNVDQAAVAANFATTGLLYSNIRGITFVGGKSHIDTGAYLALGALWCRFEELWSFDSSGIGLNFENFQHCYFKNLYQSSQVAGGGIRFACTLDATLLPGNSTIAGEIYTYTPLRNARSIVFEASGPNGCQFNQLKVSGRLQSNRYGGDQVAVSAVTTAGSPNITVSDNTNYSYLQVGSPVVWSGTAPGGFSLGTVYFVASRPSANTITLALSPLSSAAISATASGTFTAQSNGFAGLEIIANSTSIFTNCDFGFLDVEAKQAIAAIVLRRTRQCTAFLSEYMSNATYGFSLVGRDTVIDLPAGYTTSLVTDVDNMSVNIRNMIGGVRDVTASESLANSRFDCALRNTTATGITLTVAKGLPVNFKCDAIQGAAGAITFAAGSGVTIISKGGLLNTSGQGAVVKLRQVAKDVYSLSGDLV